MRDLGWQLVWVDSAQEALDTALIAYRVAEDRRVFLPCAIACDGAFLTHSQSMVKIPPQEWVNAFLPPYNRGDLQLHPDNPITIAPQVNEDWLMELRKHNDEAMKRSRDVVIPEAYRDFERKYATVLQVDPSVRGFQRVLLVDDVCTHGGTLKVISDALWAAKPGIQIVACVANQMIVKAAVANTSTLVK